MAWVTPPTFVSGNALAAAQLNVLSGDLNETSVAKATAASRYYISTGANSIVERLAGASQIATNESTASVAYTTLPTAVTLSPTTGGWAVLFFNVSNVSTTTSNNVYTSVNITGATTIAPSDQRAIVYGAANTTVSNRMGVALWQPGLTPGVNTFTLNYRASAGSASWSWRELIAFPL
jgi:hypothetical protein